MNLLWKLLRQNISPSQFISFIATNILGLSILLFSILLYLDIVPLFSNKNNIDNDNYIVLTKNVGTIGSILGANTTFSDDEINEITKQSFTQSIGAFTSSQYNVWAELEIANARSNLSTAMFFESLPDEFVDIDSQKWNYTEGNDTIPIIIPRDYLDLYNFGFAEAQHLPKISEPLISQLNIKITILSNYKQQTFIGKIIGFSNRINTILVPDKFMFWSNNQFGNISQPNPAKIIIKTSNIADENITKFVNKKNYNISKTSENTSKTTFILKTIKIIILFIGLIISILSLYILSLSIHLLIQKNKEKIENLHLIGYSAKEISKPYIQLTSIINITTFCIAITIALSLRTIYINYISQIFNNFNNNYIYFIIPISIIILILITYINLTTINTKITTTNK
jgi:hypothetical protein